MDQLLNAIKSYAASLDQVRGAPRVGTIEAIDAESGCAKVLYQPEGVLSGWLPITSSWTGDNWGLVCLPAKGDQVLVVPQESDPANGIIIGALYSDQRRRPAAPAGEFWLVHKSGSRLVLKNDGTVLIKGDLHVDGDVYDRIGSLARLRAAHNAHQHTDSMGRSTSAPTSKDQ
ncbi:MAG: phage baseplate assembly protein V [Rhodospirillales bacterium]|nr:phage baseplate assembly protein V [Rhodospirillales bacterium]